MTETNNADSLVFHPIPWEYPFYPVAWVDPMKILPEYRSKKEQAMLPKTKFPHLQQTVNRDDYEWLEVHAPEYLESVERELEAGRSPEAIHRFLLSQIGTDRAALARRCLNAARWIKANRQD